ncbi:small acid-soluble spore protein H (minor) [Natronobacillus azotifigens]|uniref:Small, acid-soluble spore protein H n=1 Tax=Natronobacillus azotifigens TaxID=472978 RepID=A0A9J6R7U4_9BACI|nr:small acid-soluble spore protein H [Natronobacillus azotifigens]MCZ0701693.1 small acid-soluble spore protein H [Natronobacillus azotifigens]
MDAQRAQDITSSPEMINVTCQGKKIYIEHVDQDKGLATIHPLDQPEQKQSVPVKELEEH